MRKAQYRYKWHNSVKTRENKEEKQREEEDKSRSFDGGIALLDSDTLQDELLQIIERERRERAGLTCSRVATALLSLHLVLVFFPHSTRWQVEGEKKTIYTAISQSHTSLNVYCLMSCT